MRIMESSDSSRELLDNVAMTEVSAPFMMQRIGVEPSQLLTSELLPPHGGLVVDMTNNEYLPAVSYATDDLLEHHLTEEDRNLAAALVAVQLVQQQKQQQMHQDSNVIVSTNSLASLVSSSNLENGKVELGEQLVISSVDKPVISSINNTYINIEERHHHLHHDSILKKYGDITVEPIRNEYISIKNENDESLQQRDSDCENKNDVRTSKKSLPHKKRISRKLQKKMPLSKKGHKCTMCEQTFNSVDELNAHANCHSVNIVVQPNPFSCQICGLICNDQLTFFQHLKSHYEPSFHSIPMANEAPPKELESNTNEQRNKDSFFLPSLYCKECGKNFRRQKAYDAHMENAHNKIEDEFSEPEDLMEGIRGVVEANHDDDTDDDVVDSKGWHYTTALETTENNLHQGVEAQEPEQRGERVENMEREPVHTNANEQEQVCHLCGQIFHSNEEVIQHLQECKATVETKLEQTSDAEEQEGKSRVRKKRRKNGTLFCPHCDRVFSHRNSLMYHMRGHTGERPHQCDICGKSFFAASALKVHMRLHSGDKPYKCEYCGRHFRQWGDLKYHCISIHSDEKNYQCEYCGKDFARKYSLIVHRRIHTGEKNYRCEFCGKTFRASSYLQNHRRIHTGEKPHPCEICGKPFRVRSDMKRHLNTHARRKNSGPVSRVTDNANTNTQQATVIELTEGGDSSNNIVGEDERLLEGEHEQEHEPEHDEQISEESDVQYQVSRDPLETVRDGPNTLFNNGHLLICYPSELQARTTMDTQWVNSDS